jgi:aryl-alcohol dehydrogenase-like predicted oxidoreductase
MHDRDEFDTNPNGTTRRRFLRQLGRGAAVGVMAAPLVDGAGGAPARGAPVEGRVRRRRLGKTDLQVSEIGLGGHSWSYKRTPDGHGGLRQVTVEEATEMIALALDLGVNFLDSCTPDDESRIPGEALHRLKRRHDAVIAVRVSHKMKGVKNDIKEVYAWTEKRLRLWQTDYIDVLLLSNEVNVTERSGYWDMTYSIEALEQLKEQGKIRYTGFGSHFEPKWFYVAFAKFASHFDCCSMPYNIRHRVGQMVMPIAKEAGLGVIAIKPFARGSLLKDRALDGADRNLPQEMLAFVLENAAVDVCLCGVHTLAQVKQNLSASGTKLTPEQRAQLESLAAASPLPHGEYCWLEEGWRHA